MHETEQPNLYLECALVVIVITDESTPFAAIPKCLDISCILKYEFIIAKGHVGSHVGGHLFTSALPLY